MRRIFAGRSLAVLLVSGSLASLTFAFSEHNAVAASWVVSCDSSDYGCATGGYNATTAASSGVPWRYYGAGEASYNSYGPHNCTLYAAYKLEQNGVTVNWSANASGWAINAAERGVRVDGTPAVGAIAQWNFGHVAYVEQVGPGYIITTDDNYGENRTTRQLRTLGSGWPDNFIHFKDLVSPPPARPAGSPVSLNALLHEHSVFLRASGVGR